MGVIRNFSSKEARARSAQAQKRMKATYDGKHHSVEFAVGYFRVAQTPSLPTNDNRASSLHEALTKILWATQEGSGIHNVFHVPLTKAHRENVPMNVTELPSVHDGRTRAVLNTHSRWGHGKRKALVQ